MDIVNYFVLALGQAIAVGYEPQEEWLREALISDGPEPVSLDQFREQVASLGDSLTLAHVPKGKDGDEAIEVCCNPGADDCCDGEPDNG